MLYSIESRDRCDCIHRRLVDTILIDEYAVPLREIVDHLDGPLGEYDLI